MIDQQVEARKAASTSAAMSATEDAQALALANAQVQESDYAALVPVMTPVLERELAHANSLGKVQEVQDQIESVRRIMEQVRRGCWVRTGARGGERGGEEERGGERKAAAAAVAVAVITSTYPRPRLKTPPPSPSPLTLVLRTWR